MLFPDCQARRAQQVVLGPRPADEDKAGENHRHDDGPHDQRPLPEPVALHQVQEIEAHNQHRQDRHPAIEEQQVRRVELALVKDLQEQERRDAGRDRRAEHKRQPLAEMVHQRIVRRFRAGKRADQQHRCPGQDIGHRQQVQHERRQVERQIERGRCGLVEGEHVGHLSRLIANSDYSRTRT